MRAAQINRYGNKTALKITNNAPKPKAGKGQILVEVYAAAVNPFDVKVREGRVKKFINLDLPATLGGDAAGKVAELGEGVEGFEIGQAVFGSANAAGGQGSFAEFTTAKAIQLAPKPKNIGFEKAAAAPLSAASAYQALIEHINPQKGQKILIHGGAGGIGSMAIQIAKHIGVYVATTVATTDIYFVKNLGADEVIDYKTQDFSTIIKNYNAVLDTVGGETNSKSYEVLKQGGTLVSMVQPIDEVRAKKYKINYIRQESRTTTERLNKIAELIDSGALKINVDKVFPLDQAAEAVEYLKSGHPKGKVVIQVKE